MAHPKLIETMRAQKGFPALLARLPGPGEAVSVGGLPGSAPSLLMAALAAAEPRRLWVVVAGTPARAETVQADLEALLGEDHAALYPQREALPYEAAEPHLEVAGLRVEALEALLAGRVRILVTTARALQELAEIPRALTELRLTLELKQRLRPQELVERLESLGFERSPLVQGVGEYALRGGILDLFGFGSPEPVRVEFWGDEIVSLRHFDILDQRSTGAVERVDVLPVDLRSVESAPEEGSERRSLLDVVPRDAVLLEWPDDLDAEGAEHGVAAREAQLRALFERTWEEVRHLNEAERRRGGSPEAPQTLFLPPERALARLRELGRVAVVPLRDAEVTFRARPPEAIERDTGRLAALLETGAARGEDTLILCDNPGQLERLEELLGGPAGLPARATLALGTVAAGFVLEGAEPPVRVLTDHEIFRRERRLRRGRRFQGAVALESLSQLKPGDYVVHLDHGVGRFRGLERVRVGEEEIESLSVEYAGGEILRVPIYRLDLVERWVPDRDEAPAPRVHKIGGKAWKTLRRKTEQAIQEMAAELLELYAAREMAGGHAFPRDTRWQREMESAFLYEDTPDQRRATADVKADMEAGRPMDRLICGDVGYGKTEVAIRAAFKAVQDGKQVAVLAPTTILVEQHAHTFAERLAGFPVKIEALSRFRSAREQAEILAGLADGSLDIVVGTHRLLQPDLLFRDLGLLVVDEEQRFGVKHKERLKDLKKDVDVLSLTATPIPRTLSMAISGLRDLTLIQTPPRDRMPVITHVLPWHDEVLEDAMR
ncbi:MAG TPA: DEAD/DEAH box helicase, partial [Longimicrobiales bacterium]|nr:DEAD/DEAH box helicase [Longimicrobiales bacterium]